MYCIDALKLRYILQDISKHTFRYRYCKVTATGEDL